jgi:hypothetical protein
MTGGLRQGAVAIDLRRQTDQGDCDPNLQSSVIDRFTKSFARHENACPPRTAAKRIDVHLGSVCGPMNSSPPRGARSLNTAAALQHVSVIMDGPTNTLPKMAQPFSRMLAGLSRASCRRSSMAPISPTRSGSGLRSAIPPASRCSGSGATIGIGDPSSRQFVSANSIRKSTSINVLRDQFTIACRCSLIGPRSRFGERRSDFR